jgi:hypothetical protein
MSDTTLFIMQSAANGAATVLYYVAFSAIARSIRQARRRREARREYWRNATQSVRDEVIRRE